MQKEVQKLSPQSDAETRESDCKAKSGLRSIVVLPATEDVAEDVALFCSRSTAFRFYDESVRYAGAVIHD